MYYCLKNIKIYLLCCIKKFRFNKTQDISECEFHGKTIKFTNFNNVKKYETHVRDILNLAKSGIFAATEVVYKQEKQYKNKYLK